MATHQIGVDELLFAVEVVVERSTGYARMFDDAVDTDGVDSLGVEELVGGGEEPVPGWRPVVGVAGDVTLMTPLDFRIRW